MANLDWRQSVEDTYAMSMVEKRMDIFISWSGARSRELADALALWLPRVIQSVRPWVSTRGIGKGARWSDDIAKQLDHHSYGIICVTPENRGSTWLNFEAGALSKTGASRTYTLLLGLNHSEIEQPLAQFNHTLANRDDMYTLLQNINETCDVKLESALLEHAFQTNWEFLQRIFESLVSKGVPKEEASSKPNEAPSTQVRDDSSMIQEILELVRAQNRPGLSGVGDQIEEARIRTVQGLIESMIFERKLHATFRVTARVANRIDVQFFGPDKTVGGSIRLTDSLALIEIRVGQLLDRLVDDRGIGQN
jgi:hypothetical protein